MSKEGEAASWCRHARMGTLFPKSFSTASSHRYQNPNKTSAHGGTLDKTKNASSIDGHVVDNERITNAQYDRHRQS